MIIFSIYETKKLNSFKISFKFYKISIKKFNKKNKNLIQSEKLSPVVETMGIQKEQLTFHAKMKMMSIQLLIKLTFLCKKLK